MQVNQAYCEGMMQVSQLVANEGGLPSCRYPTVPSIWLRAVLACEDG